MAKNLSSLLLFISIISINGAFAMNQDMTLKQKESTRLADGLQITLTTFSIEQTAPDPTDLSQKPESGVNVSLNLKLNEASETVSLYQGSGPKPYSPQVIWKVYKLSIVELKNLSDKFQATIKIEK